MYDFIDAVCRYNSVFRVTHGPHSFVEQLFFPFFHFILLHSVTLIARIVLGSIRAHLFSHLKSQICTYHVIS